MADLVEVAAQVVSEFDAMVDERVRIEGISSETDRLCKFRETHIQRLRVAVAMAKRRSPACPTCGHAWAQHDPDDGACDAHSDEENVLGPCRCGREVEFTAKRNAALSRAALGEGTDG